MPDRNKPSLPENWSELADLYASRFEEAARNGQRIAWDAGASACAAWLMSTMIRILDDEAERRGAYHAVNGERSWSRTAGSLSGRFEVAAATSGQAVWNPIGAASMAFLLRKMAQTIDGEVGPEHCRIPLENQAWFTAVAHLEPLPSSGFGL